MSQMLVYTGGTGAAAFAAADCLRKKGIPLVSHPTPEVTHLLLDVPTLQIPSGLLERLPESVTVVGGLLDSEELAGCKKLDLLKSEDYLAANAAITADCALRVAAGRMNTVFSGSTVLVIGWGRIGKCLTHLLQSIGCRVTVAARKDTDRAMAAALGMQGISATDAILFPRWDIIFNTAPAPVLNARQLSRWPEAIKIDLATSPGLEGDGVIRAKGLPGLYAPISSGHLIAEQFLKEVLP